MSSRLREAWVAGWRGICVALCVAIAASGDILVLGQEANATKGVTFTDLRGQEHVDARLLRAESGQVVIMSASGVSRLPAAVIPPEVRKTLGVSDSMVQPAPGEEKGTVPEGAPSANKPAPAPGPSTDDLEMAKIRAETEKAKAELQGLEASRTSLKEDYSREFEVAKKKIDARYELDMQEYEKKMRHRRNPGLPPERTDPDLDPAVAKLKERLEQYGTQIKEREAWLHDLGQRERAITGRLAALRRAEADQALREKTAQQREEALRLAQMRAEDEQRKHQEMYAEGRRRVEEREAREKEEAEARARVAKEKLDRVIAQCAAIEEQGKGGDVRGAFLKLEALHADKSNWDIPGGDALGHIADSAVELFATARKANELAIATSSIRVALALDGQSAKLSQELMRFFDDAGILIRDGDFSALEHQLQFIKDVGLEGSNLVVRKKHELSDAALDRGWEAFRGLHLVTAGAAVDMARQLWDRNPRLGWLRNSMGVSFFVGILIGLFVIFKGVEKLYWWLNRS